MTDAPLGGARRGPKGSQGPHYSRTASAFPFAMFVDKLQITREGFRTSRPDGQWGVPQLAKTFGELAPLLGAQAALGATVRLRDVLSAIDLGGDTVLLDVVLGQTVEPFLRRMQDQRRALGPKPKAIVIRNVLLPAMHDNRPVQVLQREVLAQDEAGQDVDLGAFPLERLLDAPLRYEPALTIVAAGAAGAAEPRATTGKTAKKGAGQKSLRPGSRGGASPLGAPSAVPAAGVTVQWGLSLVELLQALFWEMSFHGTPAERDAAAAALAGTPLTTEGTARQSVGLHRRASDQGSRRDRPERTARGGASRAGGARASELKGAGQKGTKTSRAGGSTASSRKTSRG